MGPEAHLLQKRRGGVVQRLLPFYAVHLVPHCRQYGALVATACSDFEHVGSFGEPEQFCLPGHRKWVADGLPSPNAKSFVVVCKMDKGIVHEIMPRHPVHGIQHRFICDAHLPQFAQQFTAEAFVAVAVCKVGG